MELPSSHAPCQSCINDPGSCGGDCFYPVMERNRYFDGKLMVARDFGDEQNYFNSRHNTHNRYLHGYGIVCGLEIECHPDPGCRPRWIVVRGGMAIDCCGKQLYLGKDTAYELSLPQFFAGEGDIDNTSPVQPAPQQLAVRVTFDFEAADKSVTVKVAIVSIVPICVARIQQLEVTDAGIAV